MITLGVVLAVIAVIMIILGFAVHAVNILLWIGLGLVVVGVILAVVGRGRRTPL
jgi:uncharacterized membrane protein YGL010W